MDNITELKQGLSMSMQDELDRQLISGENVLISLPGSFGEAFMLTDRRVFIIREKESGINPDFDIFGYVLSDVTGADAIVSGIGGYIELRLKKDAPQPDAARVYFPSYDADKFKSAASFVTEFVASQPAASVVAPVTTGPLEAVGDNCPKCGSPVKNDAAFCSQCGEQVRLKCADCGEVNTVGSKYCNACGREMIESSTACPKCNTRVLRYMSYCPECGSIQHQSCLACGAALVSSWKYCANCGRLLGSNRLDPHAAHAAQNRLQQLKETESTPAVADMTSVGSAEDYNKRGQELFNNEDIVGAIREFEMAVKIDPNNASYHCNLAVAYDENEQDAEAFAEYEKTLQITPNDLTALLCLGYTYNENENPDKARDVWNKVLMIAPDSAEAQEAKENLRHLGQI